MKKVLVLLVVVLLSPHTFAQWTSDRDSEAPPRAETLAATIQSFESRISPLAEEAEATLLSAKMSSEAVAPFACTTYSLPYAGVSGGMKLWGVTNRFMPSANSCYISDNAPWDFWSVSVSPGEQITFALRTNVRTFISIGSPSVYSGITQLQPDGTYLGGYVWNVPASFSSSTVSIAVSPYATSATYTLAVGKPETSTATCTTTSTTLCLSGGRFKVEATYRDYSANTGQGKAQKLTDNSGYFYFFDPSNVELVAKFVSFCNGSSGNWAIYASGLTDVEVVFKVTDTKTGLYKEYKNALGNRFCTIGDGPFTCP